MMYIKKYGEDINNNLPLLLVGLAAIATIIYCYSSGISGNDFWWHVKVGEYICDTHSIPTSDIFSWIGMEKEISWTAHEWLSDVVFYQTFNNFGEIGIFLLSIASAFIMTGLLWLETKKYIFNNFLICGVFLIFFSVLSSMFFYGRPHIFSFFLLFAELKILYKFNSDNSFKGIYFIPLLSLLWSNLHGGSASLSYILCILFLVIGVCKINIGRIQNQIYDTKACIKLSLVTIATLGAVFVNPIGLRVFIYPYQTIVDTISMLVISEWQSPNAKNMGELILYFIPLAIVVIGIIASRMQIAAIDIGVMSFFTFLFLRSSRFVILWYISVCFFGLKYLPECKVKKIKGAVEKISLLICMLFLISLIGYSMGKGIDTIKNKKELISTVISEEAVAVIKNDNPQRIFNDYNIGEALIFNEIPVFFDARADLFAQENIMADGVSMMFMEQANKSRNTSCVNIGAMIDEYRIDAIAILKSRPLYSYLISHPEKYRIIYEDSELAYYRVVGNNM